MAPRDERARMATATDRGIAQGREQEALSIAKALKAKDISADIIMQCTGLSEAEIQAL